MFGRMPAVVIAFVALLNSSGARADLPSLQGMELPSVVTVEDVMKLNDKRLNDGCKTPHCRAWGYVAVAFDRINYALSFPGTNVWLGREEDFWPVRFREGSRALNKLLRPVRALYPAMCQDLIAIVARDDPNRDYSHRPAAMAFEVARRISGKRLDCLGEVLPLIPPGPYRTHALEEANDFCVADRHQDCRRLKPPEE